MKHKALVTVAAVLPIAALAVGSALAQPPHAVNTNTAAVAFSSVARPDWHVRIVSPLTFVVSDKVASSGILSTSASEAAKLLDS